MVGAGTCRGTRFGISAAAYPDLDIVALSLDAAKALYQRDYWQRIAGDLLPAALALLVFDAAINSGTNRAAHWLQLVAQVPQDGVIGEQTLHAIGRTAARQGGVVDLCSEFLALRLAFMTSLPTWKTFGIGWARRLCRLPVRGSGRGLPRPIIRRAQWEAGSMGSGINGSRGTEGKSALDADDRDFASAASPHSLVPRRSGPSWRCGRPTDRR